MIKIIICFNAFMLSCFPAYHDAVRFLESLSNIPLPDYMQSRWHSDFYLKRASALVEALKINLNQFKLIHIAGTAGKGSTVAAVHQILYESGHNVGSFYSPHATTTIERIKVNHKYINPDDFVNILNQIKSILDKMCQSAGKGFPPLAKGGIKGGVISGRLGSPSYFEILLAIALQYFQQTKCEYVVLETGCGGEFDATNIIKNPVIAAITNIGLDHTNLLGNTLTQIAKTKAGIIKPGSIFLTTENRPRLLKIFKKICKQNKTKFITCSIGAAAAKGFPPLTKGGIKRGSANALLASAICRQLNIPDKYIKSGLNHAFLPCRFEIIQQRPLVVLDGAHNPDKIKTVVANLNQMHYQKLFLIITVNADKDYKSIIKLMSPLIDFVFITRHLAGDRPCTDLKLMYNQFRDTNKKISARIFLDPWSALELAQKQANPKDLILITGSFYLAGELRKRWISEEQILKNAK